LLLVDVDQFNQVNLAHGYYAGDQILRFIADKILGCVRTNDIVGRIGGEEFGVILLKSSKESAQMIANRILASVEHLSDEMHLNLKSPITLSGGIAGFPMDADTPESLVQKAQTAIISAKIMGETPSNFLITWRSNPFFFLPVPPWNPEYHAGGRADCLYCFWRYGTSYFSPSPSCLIRGN